MVSSDATLCCWGSLTVHTLVQTKSSPVLLTHLCCSSLWFPWSTPYRMSSELGSHQSPLGPGLHPHQAPHAALTQGPGTSGSLKPVVNFPSLSQLASQLHQILVTPTPTLTPNAHFKTLFPFSVPETSVLPSKITNKLTAPQCPHCIWTHMGYCPPGVSFSVFHRHPSANTPKTVLMSPLCRAPSP